MDKIDALKTKMQSSEPLGRDEVRKIYEGGLPSFEEAHALRELINRQMLDEGLMEGTFHMCHPSMIKVTTTAVFLRCCSYYFDDRQAVSFEDNGFIGFAGWADRYNVQPILRGFVLWAEARALEAQEREG